MINPSLPLVEKWYYLRQNQWVPLDTDKYILEDETDGLRKAGSLRLTLPKDITDEDSLLTRGFFWFRVDTYQQSGVVEIPISARTPQLSIQFSGKQNDFGRLANPLSEGSIAKPFKNDANLKSVQQLYQSFGGKIAEKNADFHTRVSERLRHKGRGIALFDYERLILNQFPDIYRVKCIRHTLPDLRSDNGIYKDHMLAPGYVSVAVIPALIDKTFADPLQPKADLSVLKQIEIFLQEKISPFVHVCVLNPIYESIKVSCSIAYRPGFSPIFNHQELMRDKRQVLGPWAFNAGADIVFGGKVYASSIIQFIEKRRYVAFVKDFRLDVGSIDPDESEAPCRNQPGLIFPAIGSGTIVQASNVRSVLTSYKEHSITEYKP